MISIQVPIARFVTLLGLSVWLGGLVFAGICAPVLFRIARENNVEAVAPQAFGVMLGRFQLIAVACGLLALAGWLGERRRVAQTRSFKLWRTQGVLIALMLLITGYMAALVFPRMGTLQRAFLPQFRTELRPSSLVLPPKSVGGAARQEFDVLHTRSTRLTMLVLWLGVGTLAAFAWRTSKPEQSKSE